MTWAYVFATASYWLFNRGKPKGKLFVPIVLMMGILPDADLLLSPFGVEHHTFMHSLIFWLVLFVPFLLVYRRRVIPYLAAVVQHFAFGDFIFGTVMILWPFSHSFFGFGLSMGSTLDVAFETTGLLLFVGVSYFNGDLKRLLSVDPTNFLMILPFLALLISMLHFAVDWSATPLIAYVLSSKKLTVLVLSHTALLAVLAVSTLQGLKARVLLGFIARGNVLGPS